jgi:hypothetical protein
MPFGQGLGVDGARLLLDEGWGEGNGKIHIEPGRPKRIAKRPGL